MGQTNPNYPTREIAIELPRRIPSTSQLIHEVGDIVGHRVPGKAVGFREMQNVLWLMIEGLEENEFSLLSQPWEEYNRRFQVPLNNLKDIDSAFSRSRALNCEDGYQPFLGVEKHAFNDRLERLWWACPKVAVPGGINPGSPKKFVFKNKKLWAFGGMAYRYKYGDTDPIPAHLPPGEDLWLNVETGNPELFEAHEDTGRSATFRSVVFQATDIVWDKATGSWLDPDQIATDFRGTNG